MQSSNNKFGVRALIAALALIGYADLAQSGPVTDQMLAADPGDSWLHTNGNYGGHRFSTLNSINAANAKDLKVALGLRTKFDVSAPANFGLIPLVHKGLVDVGYANWFVEAAFPITAMRDAGYSLAAVFHTGFAF